MKWPKIPPAILGQFSPTSWLLAQETHILLGIIVLLFSKAYNIPLWIGAVAILGFALFKETVIDPWLEGNPFFWNGFVDLLFYVVGLGVGLLLIYFADAIGLAHLF